MLQESGGPGLCSTETQRWESDSADLEAVAYRFVDRLLEKVELGVRLPQDEMELVRQAAEAVPVRKFLIKQSDLNTHGHSDRCRRCTSTKAGQGRQLHSKGFGKRLELATEGSAKVAERRRVARTGCIDEQILDVGSQE